MRRERTAGHEAPPGRGESGRIAVLLVAQRAAIQGYALAITADHQLAEDVYQDVATVVASDPGQVPAGGDGARWLREVTRRKALERLRSARRGATPLSHEVLEALGTAFAPRTEHDALRDALEHCIERVPGTQRSLLDGRYRDNLSAEELAQRVGRSVQGVYAVLKRLRRALADCMRAHMDADGRMREST